MTDSRKPILTSLSFHPAIDLSTGSQPLTFTATGSDDASGIADLIIYFSKPISYAFNPTSSPSSFSLFIADGTYPDTWADGQTATTFTISPFNAPGIYTIDHITLSDHVGNTQIYSAADLSSLGSPTSLTITGGHADTDAPVLTSFSFNSVIDVSGGSKPLTFTAAGSPSSFSLFIADGSYPDTWTDGQTATTFTISPQCSWGLYD